MMPQAPNQTGLAAWFKPRPVAIEESFRSGQTQAQEAFAARMAEKHIIPLWTVATRLMRKEPAPVILPVHLNYQRDVRPCILEAADLITAAEAHRRAFDRGHCRDGGGR